MSRVRVSDAVASVDYYENVLHAPVSSKVYFDKDGSMLVWHSSPGAADFAKSYMMGGFTPGEEAGSLYGDGLYTNITPCRTVRRSYGPYVHVFRVKMDDDTLRHTCIADPEVYKQMHGGELPEDWFVNQFMSVKRIANDEAIQGFLRSFQEESEKNCTHDLYNGWASSDWMKKYYPVLRNLGFRNIVYWGHNDRMCWVSWEPYKAAQHVAVFKCVDEENFEWALVSESDQESGGGQAGNEMGGLLASTLTSSHGDFQSRLEKLVRTLPEDKRAALVEYIKSNFPDDKYTATWKPSMIRELGGASK